MPSEGAVYDFGCVGTFRFPPPIMKRTLHLSRYSSGFPPAFRSRTFDLVCRSFLVLRNHCFFLSPPKNISGHQTSHPTVLDQTDASIVARHSRSQRFRRLQIDLIDLPFIRKHILNCVWPYLAPTISMFTNVWRRKLFLMNMLRSCPADLAVRLFQ